MICINGSLTTGIFPEFFKISKVIPVYKKKGSRNVPNNYRPISVVSSFSKVFEVVMKNQICNYLEKYNLISSNVLRDLVGYIIDALECKESVQAEFCVLRKAPDCVEHDLLKTKLLYIGFSDNTINLISLYLE